MRKALKKVAPAKKTSSKLPDKTVRLNQVFLDLKADGRVKTKKDFAESLDVDYNHLVMTFAGKKETTDRLSNKLAEVYRISKPWLLFGVGDKTEALPDEPENTKLLKQIAADISAIRTLIEQNYQT